MKYTYFPKRRFLWKEIKSKVQRKRRGRDRKWEYASEREKKNYWYHIICWAHTKEKWLRRQHIWTKVCKLFRSLCGRTGIKVHFHRRGQSNICNLCDLFNGKHTFQKQNRKANVCRLILLTREYCHYYCFYFANCDIHSFPFYFWDFNLIIFLSLLSSFQDLQYIPSHFPSHSWPFFIVIASIHICVYTWNSLKIAFSVI